MDPKLTWISRLSMAIAVALIASCAGPEGQPGAAGANGTNGATGATGTTGANGTNGSNGTNGAPCTVTAYDGGVTVTCPGSAPVDVPNGTDGASCTVANIDGGVVVSCPGSSPVTVLNGNNGTNGNNGQTGLGLSTGLKVTVTSVSSTNPVVIRFKVMDDRNNPVDLNGNYSINTPFVPRFALAYIPVTDAGVVLAYKVYTQSGSATAAATTDPAPAPASVVVQPTAFSPTFPIPTAGVPATDAAMKGLLVENGTGFGDYTYTFPTGGNTQIKNSSNKFVTTVVAPAAFDAAQLSTTHTIWIQIARQTDILNPNTVQGFTARDIEYNFVPNGSGTAGKREIVTQAACNKCHNGFKRDLNPNVTAFTVNGFHGGGRVEAPFCNVCHNPDRVSNPAANSAVFVHRLHGSSHLASNPDGGAIPANAFHDIQVGFPQDIRNCDACHAGATQGAQATRPSIAACGSCHDAVDFAAGSALTLCANPEAKDAEGRPVPCKHKGGPQADNTNCAMCHGGPTSVAPLALSHLAVVSPDPSAPMLNGLPDGGFGLPDGGAGNNNTNAAFIGAAGDIPPGATAVTYDVKSVAISATNHPQIVFKLKASVNGAAATDVDFGTWVAGTNTELIPGFVGSPSAYFAFAVPQDGIAAPADFNASASCYIRTAWINGAASTTCSLSAKDSAGYYTLDIGSTTVPTSAKMFTGGIGYTYSIQTARPLTQVNLTAYPYSVTTGIGGLIVAAPDVSKVATGHTARRVVVETARCNNCHAQLGVGPTFHAGQRNDAPTCTFCHTPNRTSAAWSANAKDFIHSIHGGRVRTVPFNWHAISPSENFSEVEFPSNINNCQACHVPGAYDFSAASTQAAFPNMLASTVATGIFNRSATTNPTGWFSISPADYVTADNAFDYGFGFATSNVNATLPNAISGTQGGNACTSAAPCTCTAANPCSIDVSGPMIASNTSVNFTQKIGAVTNACNAGTPCTCTTAQPCTAVVATCSLGAPCNAQQTTLVKSPIVAACSACHDAKPTIAHMEAMGGTFYKTRSAANGKFEQCLICHGPGTIAPIEVMHR